MLKEKIGGGIKRFFSETFRAHTKEEYFDFFARKGDGVYKTYPFMWIRVLALEVMLFAVVLIVSEFTGYDTFWTYAVLTGGLLLNIPVFILAYELYPNRDLGFLRYFIAFFVGGVASIALTLLAYYAYEPDNKWLSALWTGFVEEFFKAVPAIVFIVAYRNKNPLFGFMMGAAVGAGVSVIEDMYYIHNTAGAWGFWGNSWQTLIETSVGRGLTAGCTHTLWTALIGWAFCKFKKPLINFRFYLAAVLCVALHFAWDLPLEIMWAQELIYIGCAVAGLAFAIVILYKERKKVFGGGQVMQAEQLAVEEVAVSDTVAAKRCAFGLSHVANLVAVLCLCVIAVFTVGVCYSNWGFVSYREVYFDSIEELIDYIQGGMQFDINDERLFDEDAEMDTYRYKDGVLVSATQTETKDGMTYYYNYVLDDEGYYIGSVNIDVDGTLYKQYTNYFWTGDVVIFYSPVNVDFSYNEEKGQYYVTEYCDEYYHGLEGTVAVVSVMGLVLTGGTAAFITLKIKARRKNDVG